MYVENCCALVAISLDLGGSSKINMYNSISKAWLFFFFWFAFKTFYDPNSWNFSRNIFSSNFWYLLIAHTRYLIDNAQNNLLIAPQIAILIYFFLSLSLIFFNKTKLYLFTDNFPFKHLPTSHNNNNKFNYIFCFSLVVFYLKIGKLLARANTHIRDVSMNRARKYMILDRIFFFISHFDKLKKR